MTIAETSSMDTRPELPTADGFYVGVGGDLWVVLSGIWFNGASVPADPDRVRDFGPLTRLVREDETLAAENARLRTAIETLPTTYWTAKGMSRYWDVTVWLEKHCGLILSSTAEAARARHRQTA